VLTGITLDTTAVKKTYALGEPFSSEGLVVTAHYDDGSAETVTDYTLTWNNAPLDEGSITAEAGEKIVTVTYGGKTAEFQITVNEPGEILTLNLGGKTGYLTVNGTLTIPNYADPDSFIQAFTVQDPNYPYGTVDLSGRTITVDIQKGTSTADTVSLVYVHFLRQALLNAGADVAGIDTTGLTPGFDGSYWAEIISWDNYWPTDPNYTLRSLFSYYPTSVDTTLMAGITVSTDETGKYMLVRPEHKDFKVMVGGRI
jgi:hypothetical protein